MGFPTSVVRYEDRGPWGDASYPGNTTGHLIVDLIDQYRPATILDPMEGSGTTRQVAAGQDLFYRGYDLKDGHNILERTTRDLIRAEAPPEGYDLIFWHPPYYDMIRYNFNTPYSAQDFSAGTYAMFLQRCQTTLEFLTTLLNKTNLRSRIAIQMGDRRLRGRYYWIVADMYTPAKLTKAKLEIDALVIREQKGVTSNNRDYATNQLIRIMHEYVHILRPIGG